MSTSAAALRSRQAEPALVTLHVAWGRRDDTVHEVMQTLLGHRPAVVWREPTPTRTRLDGFTGLWIATEQADACLLKDNWPAAALDEARLFWPDPADSGPHGMHLLAETSSENRLATRWAVFGERGEPATVSWVESTLGKPDGTDSWSCQRIRQPVLTLRDARRYGLEGHGSVPPPDQKPLTVFQYFRGTELVFWRVEPS